jgi:peptide chain release factor 1
MFDKLKGVEERFDEVETALSAPDVVKDRAAFEKLSREHAELSKVVTVYREYQRLTEELADSQELMQDSDPEMKSLARADVARLTEARDAMEVELRKLLVPKDPNDDKNIILEIRAGTGGDEAALFAADLFRCTAAISKASAGNWRS